MEKNNVVGEIFNAASENSFESNITSRQTQTSPESMVLKMWIVFNNEKKGLKPTCRPTNSDFAEFYPKSLNMERKNVVAEIFNAGSENSFDSNITSRQTQKSPGKIWF